MDYKARWYDPALGRFAQADTIVPAGVQGYDRYTYTNNNPIRYNNPTGHMLEQGDGGGSCNPFTNPYCSSPLGGGGGGCTSLACTLGSGNGNNGDDNNDDEITLTLSRDELKKKIRENSDALADYYSSAGDWWNNGSATVLGITMLFVDIGSCTALAVVTVGLSCPTAIAITVLLLPVPSMLGAVGGYNQENAYSEINEYIEDVLIDSPEEQFTLTFTQETTGEMLLPGGVPLFTQSTYTISVDGYPESTEVYIYTMVELQ